ncbi:MAG: twin-arginine translocation signal domain-containing protein [Flexistipes sinusarabici]|uniref:Twin-arginine translocation signal domain-containing protein n=1 Tax=Flexistipes sinusarabici TaxID=2352 RepID=A0A5D0MGR8_FLESI|nr:twin-arginine translocation signal domain-containing protein [Flexistipes sinusarabici]TYB32877.1 MAG: twin-arginine translocation signal domain-containing protein [Flexistipes sinusarabici]
MKNLNRRNFIKGAAVLSGAVALGAVSVRKAGATEAEGIMSQEPALPWGYEELDPEYVRKLGHLGYYPFECGGGAFWAIMTALKEKIGYPYTLLPLPSVDEVISYLETGGELPQVPMRFGGGGAAGYSSLCGAPNGAAAAINYIVPFEATEHIVRRLLRYYETEAFPTDQSNEYAANNEFLVPRYLSDKVLPKSVSNSVLCHVSVGKWCEHSGYASGSLERSERCGRLTGDVSAMAVTLLNAYQRGELETVFPFKLSHETAECRTCHAKGKDYEKGQFTRGHIECTSCHGDEMVPHNGANKLKTAYGVSVGTWTGAAIAGAVFGIGAHAISKRADKKGDDDEDTE